MGRKTARKKSIGFKANVETDQDLITWWEAIPAGERSEVLRDLVRLAISGQVRSGSQERTSQLAQLQEDTDWIREALSDLPGYLEQLVSQVARRLPTLRKREVQEAIDVLLEVWQQELAQPDGELHLRGLGTLYVETHPLRANGVTRQALLRKYGPNAPLLIPRRTIRLRPYDALRAVMHVEAERDE